MIPTHPPPEAAEVVPVVDMAGVTRAYDGPPPFVALRPTSLEVLSGDYLAIRGPSGSGKSTLLNLLGLVDTPTTGRYLLDGIDVGGLDDACRSGLRATRIGFVFQAFHLIGQRTAAENVALGLLYRRCARSERRERAHEVLDQVGLADLRNALPSTMSGGERQRVAIARAIAGQPRLLLCDEPTGNLDSANAERVLDLLGELNDQGLTVIVVSHDVDVARRARLEVDVRDGIVSPRRAAPT